MLCAAAHRLRNGVRVMSKRRYKLCSCCGGEAGAWEQWWNQDKGFGVCAKCVTFILNHVPFGNESLRTTPEQFEQMHGLPGVHYEQPKQ